MTDTLVQSTTWWFTRTSCGHGTYITPAVWAAVYDNGTGEFFCSTCGISQIASGKTTAQKERERADRLAARAERAERRSLQLREEAAHERRRGAAARGQVTKIKKRVGKGVCPCCNRHFVNVERHMAGQHPEYVDAPDEVSS